jgi:hypothetical protein
MRDGKRVEFSVAEVPLEIAEAGGKSAERVRLGDVLLQVLLDEFFAELDRLAGLGSGSGR